ncbi:MAG: chloride channel protein [Candidatus Binataceae bacterium]|nr:chloride channel protein [Candidatus Binataceae bacterium]
MLQKLSAPAWANHPLVRKCVSLVNQDLTATYSRDIQKWLLVAPLIGVTTGIVITGITLAILNGAWAYLLPRYLQHQWMIVPGLTAGFLLTGLIMRYFTADPNEHSTEEIISSYHEHRGDIDIRPFWFKLLAAVTTVGSGGSAAMEGPSIYGGGAIGSWLWTKLRRFGLDSRDRRIMLISGAAAGMSSVFRAPLTGLVFALEMPYRDDLAHEALLPSLIASVVAYATLVAFVGAEPLFGFVGQTRFASIDLVWSAALGAICGLIAMVFAITFRRARVFAVNLRLPHPLKLTIGGFLTGCCGLLFLRMFPGTLIPIGPNYEAVRMVLTQQRLPIELMCFAILKLAATLFSLGSGGVSAMFVPLFLVGACVGSSFAQSIVHAPAFNLYAAVGMAAFIAAGYKTPLAAVVFVAEATGGHSYLIPTLIGAAVAYAISGEASVSGDQRLHQTTQIAELGRSTVREVMRKQVVFVFCDTTLSEFADGVAAHHRHAIYPVLDGSRAIGTLAVWSLSGVAPDKWAATKVDEITDRNLTTVAGDCDLNEALRLLMRENAPQMLLVTGDNGALEGIVTKTDVLHAVQVPVSGAGTGTAAE